MKLESSDSADSKKRWKIVRTDFCGPNGGDVDGVIISADDETGECTLAIPDGAGGTKTETMSFGAGGIRIVGRR